MTRVLLAAAALLTIGGAAYTVAEGPAEHSTVTAETVFDSPDARVRAVTVDGGQFRVALSGERGLIAVLAEMPPLPAGKSYQLWVIHDRARSLGVFHDGRAFAPIPSTGRLAVTAEPAGGSPQPTEPPLFAVPLDRL